MGRQVDNAFGCMTDECFCSDILAFFSLYEMTAEDLQVPKCLWSSQVTGVLSDLMDKLLVQYARDYEYFKNVSHLRVALSSEHCREAFCQVDRAAFQQSLHVVLAKASCNS